MSDGIITWNLDWCCYGCRKYGAIQVQITGGTRNERTGMLNPKTDDEGFVKLLWESHHKEAITCTRDVRSLLIGRMWRHVKAPTGVRIVILERNGGTRRGESYKWPPWLE